MKKLALFLSLILAISAFAAKDKYEGELNEALNTFNESKVKSLVDSKKVDLNKRDKLGWTQLEGAIAFNEYKKAEILLKYGANPNLKNKDGKTLLHLCSDSDDIQCIILLAKYKAEINTKDNYGKTPLYYALVKDNKRSANLLEKYGGINSDKVIKKKEEDSFVKTLETIANLNKGKIIDDVTRFEYAKAHKNYLSIYFTFLSNKSNVLKFFKDMDNLNSSKRKEADKLLLETKQEIKDGYIKDMCKKEFFINMKDEVLHYEYIFRIDEEKEIMRFTIYPSECRK